jgi:hypothetical protein
MSTTKENKNSEEQTYNAEITKEDMKALGKKGFRTDSGDDRLLQSREERIDFAGKDLDVPRGNNVNLTSSSGINDEENTLYGQGGERKENLEAPERANRGKS